MRIRGLIKALLFVAFFAGLMTLILMCGNLEIINAVF